MESNIQSYLSMQTELCCSSWEQEGSDHPPSWYIRAYQDLHVCFDCVVTYHNVINEAFHSSDDEQRVDPSMHEALRLSDVTRLKDSFARLLRDHDKDYELSSEFLTPFKEVLKYPGFLFDEELAGLLVKFVCELLQDSFGLEKADFEQGNGVFPGIYLLLVHPVHNVSLCMLIDSCDFIHCHNC